MLAAEWTGRLVFAVFVLCVGWLPPDAAIAQVTVTEIRAKGAAVYSGNPKLGLTCEGSPVAIGGLVGNVNGEPQAVIDINLIMKLTKLTTVPPGEVVADTVLIGWEYEDARRNYWIQWNAVTQPTYAGSISLGSIVAVAIGVNRSPDTSFHYIGAKPATLDKGLTYDKCFENGERFGS